jgi:hypothetical protein
MSTATRSRARSKRTDPAVVILGVLFIAALPVLGFFAYKLVMKKPEVIVETVIVKAPPVKKRPVEKPSADDADSGMPEGQLARMDNNPSRRQRNQSRPRARQPAGDGRPTVVTAVDRVAQDAHDALRLGKKVLVVWLFDESASAATLRREVTGQLDDFYKTAALADASESSETSGASASPDAPPSSETSASSETPASSEAPASSETPKADSATGDDAPVLSVVGGFSSVVKFATEQPEADVQKVSAAAAGLPQASDHVEKPMAALLAVMEKFGDYRIKKQRWMTIVLVTDEAGDDEAQIDEVLPQLERYSIPVNCIGVAAPFGKLTTMAIFAEGKPTEENEVRVRQGPESRFPEWIHLDFPNGRDDAESSLDTGLGPYSLTRLCKESGGDYFPLPSGGGGGDWGGGNWGRRQAGKTLPRAYAPQYLPEKTLQEELEKNKAKKALVEAAMLPQVSVIPLRTLTVDASDEVKKQQMLGNVQKPAAKLLPPIDKLLETLKAGEPDEPKLTEPRWKAGYDLAYGRAMAAKARCQGYDDMVATLKTEKFKSDKSSTWMLEPSDEPTGISVDDKMAIKARDYLNRVVKEHPGTPWANAAERELACPIGWKRLEQ